MIYLSFFQPDRIGFYIKVSVYFAPLLALQNRQEEKFLKWTSNSCSKHPSSIFAYNEQAICFGLPQQPSAPANA